MSEAKATAPETTKSGTRYGIGVDVGTGFLASAHFDDNGNVVYRDIRDAFFEIDSSMFNEKFFNKSNLKYIEFDGNVYIVGDDALTFAKLRNTSASRPLARGIINPSEKASAPILKELFRYITSGFIRKPGEKLVFSVPGKQVNNPDFDTFQHAMNLEHLFSQFGCSPEALNEAFAVILSELNTTDETTGIGFSFGAGLVNVCFAYKGVSIFDFSIDKSGDFVDQSSAKSVGESESYMSHIKETKLDLMAAESECTREQLALQFSYRYVIRNAITETKKAFLMQRDVRVLEPVPVIISGGTSMPPGFTELFQREFEMAKMPFQCSKFIKAENPLKAVAKGCLLWASSFEG